jgi:hypothetical protein
MAGELLFETSAASSSLCASHLGWTSFAALVDTTTWTSASDRIHGEVAIAISSGLSLCDSTAAGVARSTCGFLLGHHVGSRAGESGWVKLVVEWVYR